MKSRSGSALIFAVLTTGALLMACALCGWLGLIGMREMQAPTLFGAATIEAAEEASGTITAAVAPNSSGTGTIATSDATTASGVASLLPTRGPGGRVDVMTAVSATVSAPDAGWEPTPTAPAAGSAAPALASDLKGILAHDDFSVREVSALNGWGFRPGDSVDNVWSPNQYSIIVNKAQLRQENEMKGVYQDFGVEVVAQPENKNIMYGIEFRATKDAQPDQYYLFCLLPSGGYFLEKQIDGKLVQPGLVPPKESPRVNRGAAVNRLGVLAEGQTISLFINGYQVDTVTDTSLSSGTIRLVVGTFPDTVLPAKVNFSRVTVMTVERAKLELGSSEDKLGPSNAGLLFYDDFTSDQVSKDKGWNFVKDQDQDMADSADGLVWQVKANGQFMMHRAEIPSLKDFGVEVEARADDVPGTAYGILMRYGGATSDQLSHYYFGVTADGRYYLGKEVEGKYGTAPLPRVASPLINTGGSGNRLGALVEGDTISLFINGALVRTLTDNSIAAGSVGLFVASPETGPTRAVFRSLTVVTAERARKKWQGQLAAANSSGILFQEDFSSEEGTHSNGWSLSKVEGAELAWSPNKLSLVLDQANKSMYGSPSIGYVDFAAEVEMQPGAEPGTEYGISFRCTADRSTCYFFIAHTDGSYALLKKVNGVYSDPPLTGLTPTSALKQGSVSNRLGVIADGPMIMLFINGTLVRTVADDSITDGYVGVFLTSRGEKARVDVSRMTIFTTVQAMSMWNPTGILFQDEFASEQATKENGWVLGPASSANYAWQPSRLTMSLTERAMHGRNFPNGSFKDFGIEVEAQPADEDSEYGIEFRISANGNTRSLYYFGVTTAGMYYLYKMVDGQVVKPAPIEDTSTPLLQTGASKNRLGVLAEGSKISLYINGSPVTSVTDASLAMGGVGVYLVSHVDGASISFSRVTVYTAERVKTAWPASPAQAGPTAAASVTVTVTAAAGSTPAATLTPIATSTATPVRTATFTPTPQPTATFTTTRRPTATSTPSGILFTDDFTSKQASIDKGWEFDSDYTWSPGKLTMTVSTTHKITWETIPAGSLQDFGIEVEAQPQSSSGIEYGLMFRFSGDTDNYIYYLFGLTTEGKYYLYKKVNGEWSEQDPVSDTSSRYIKTGASKNRVGVLANGEMISLYINGYLVKTLADSSIARGDAALFVNNIDNKQAAVSFDRVVVYTVDRAKVELGKR